ncbi:hypothetical protein CR513_27547, partial [Mucuna pruriens]
MSLPLLLLWLLLIICKFTFGIVYSLVPILSHSHLKSNITKDEYHSLAIVTAEIVWVILYLLILFFSLEQNTSSWIYTVQGQNSK